jgi:hypothetical protein
LELVNIVVLDNFFQDCVELVQYFDPSI